MPRPRKEKRLAKVPIENPQIAMQALQLKPRTKQMKLITSVVSGVMLSLLPIPALAQLSFTPNATPPPNSGATAGGGFNDSGRSLTPKPIFLPFREAEAWRIRPVRAFWVDRTQRPGTLAAPANSGTFDPYAMNGQLTVPPVGSAPYVGANPSGYATPQTLPNGGSNPFGFNPATPQTGNAATSTMGAPTGIGGESDEHEFAELNTEESRWTLRFILVTRRIHSGLRKRH